MRTIMLKVLYLCLTASTILQVLHGNRRSKTMDQKVPMVIFDPLMSDRLTR